MEQLKISPHVSVVIAAYNRSNVLKYAIESVLWQTFDDWELIIVDDASTDNTREVVGSFSDKRIRYIKLDNNIGEQSGPNNIGHENSRGSYIAYLNQDDLWFPDHLETMINEIQDKKADWVCASGMVLLEGNKMYLAGVMPDDLFSPRYGRGVNATLWLLKREVIEKIGGWRYYRTIRIVPSQDMMFRAWRAGIGIRMTCRLTAIIVESGSRILSYSNRLYQENQFYFEQMKLNKNLRNELLAALCFANEKKTTEDSLSIARPFYRLIASLVKRAGMLLGIMPSKLYAYLRFRKKGDFIDRLRKNRGLPPIC